MTISGSGEKPKVTLVESALNSTEAVKVTTRSTSAANNNQTSNSQALSLFDNSKDEQGTSVKLGLAKYLNQELDVDKIKKERLEKIAEIKSKLAAGTYLTSISAENVSSKLLEEAQVEFLEFNKIVSNE